VLVGLEGESQVVTDDVRGDADAGGDAGSRRGKVTHAVAPG
jgi:hypothetical protein